MCNSITVYRLPIYAINSINYSSALVTSKLLVKSVSLARAANKACSALHSFWMRSLVSCSKRCFTAITCKNVENRHCIHRHVQLFFRLPFLNSNILLQNKIYPTMNLRLLYCGLENHCLLPFQSFASDQKDSLSLKYTYF